MSLHPHPIEPVPEETARIAHAAFPKGNLYLEMRDVLGTIYTDELFADLFPAMGQLPKRLGGWRWSVCFSFWKA